MLPRPPSPLISSSSSFQNNTTTEELCNIQNRLKILDSEIQKRNRERSALLQEINAINSPGGRQLPMNILSLIFTHICPPIDFNDRRFDPHGFNDRMPDPHAPNHSNFNGYHPDMSNAELNGPYLPIVLSSISCYWRQVAWSTPEIWSTMAVEVRQRTAKSHASLLHLYLRNSRPLLLGLEVDFRREHVTHHPNYLSRSLGRTLQMALQPFAHVLLRPEHATRFGVLRLIAPPYEWLSYISRFPPAVELSLGWPPNNVLPAETDPLTISSAIRPTLRTLRIHNLSHVVFPFSFPTITHIDLAWVPLHICLGILSLCPMLLHCRLHRPVHEIPIVRVLQPTVLTQLEVLEVSVWGVGTADDGYPKPKQYTPSKCICVPNLLRLKWDSRDFNAFDDFLPHLPQSMTSLHLTSIAAGPMERATWMSIFYRASQLQYLYLEEIWDLAGILDLLKALTPEYQPSDLISLLPHLSRISFILDKQLCDSMKPEVSLTFVSELIVMVGLRKEGNRKDPLRIDIDETFRWPELTDELTEDVIHAIVHDGWDLDIRQGGKIVPWLALVKESARDQTRRMDDT